MALSYNLWNKKVKKNFFLLYSTLWETPRVQIGLILGLMVFCYSMAIYVLVSRGYSETSTL